MMMAALGMGGPRPGMRRDVVMAWREFEGETEIALLVILLVYVVCGWREDGRRA